MIKRWQDHHVEIDRPPGASLPIFKYREFSAELFFVDSSQPARPQPGKTLTVSATVQSKKAEQARENDETDGTKITRRTHRPDVIYRARCETNRNCSGPSLQLLARDKSCSNQTRRGGLTPL